MQNKKCSKCKIVKQIDQFYKSQREKDGLTYLCKKCIQTKGYYQQNRNKIIKYQKAYYQKNKERYKKYQQSTTTIIQRKGYRQQPWSKYSAYKSRAKSKNFEWTLTKEQFMKFWQKPCFYCDNKIETIGLDRVNNKLGYIITNLVPCCKECNYLKGAIEWRNFKGLDKIVKILKARFFN